MKSYNAVSVHPYRNTVPETALPDFAALAQLIGQYADGHAMPMINGEWGYTSALPPCVYGNKRPRAVQGCVAFVCVCEGWCSVACKRALPLLAFLFTGRVARWLLLVLLNDCASVVFC